MKHPACILVFSTQFMPTGGIESHLKEFCLHMKQTGVIIDLVITNSQMTPASEIFFRENCRHVYLGTSKRSSVRFIWLLLAGIKAGMRRYNALYTNGQGESVLFFSRLLWRSNNWVHHHHMSGDAKDQETWGENYKETLHKATSVIACSDRNAGAMKKKLQRNIESIPCFSRKVAAGNHTNHSNIRFGYYGRLIPEKGIDILCRLSNDSDLEDVEFHLWGEGDLYPATFFVDYPKVSFHGVFNSNKELSEVIASLDAFILISTHPEGLPICLLEAMSGGLPWLATDQGGIPDIALDPASTRVISASSGYAIVKAAVRSLANDIKAGKISGASQIALYDKKFSSPALASKWQNILRLN